ncbi:hypothetical protein CfE428DRAFT_1605 [Chthoniobacter flavus Ellin428]|uniref:ArnT-like N-terminal domain-containing protein n=1 Tax=Chthoniobacter flavus Ellin428 TaxID=497964 RepID=B4CWZ2_9BACT|nr:phospholipid carrier-dependent glycosyltransferase [Chthoniobacter flavus]EDY21312.1 hypothetical protein CfE428DRAFT_1605 [Chthoniobacter flavus Ellin428]TCO84919.1 dolichyl-phosphate-mannose-protein mannosyltransferase [Chthoniobacter flavus]
MPRSIVYWSVVVLLTIFGAYFRFPLHRDPGFPSNFDEQVYIAYVDRLAEHGIASYPAIFHDYVEQASKAEIVFLPPSRVGYVVPAWLLTRLTKWNSYEALRMVSAVGSFLFALTGFFFARRWVTPRMALAVLGLLICAPLQIHLSQFVFIDGVAAFWALLTAVSVWECFQQPRRLGWAITAGFAAWALLLTKQEIAAFVALFLIVALLLGKRLGFSTDRRPVFVALTCAGLLGVLVLVLTAGGVSVLGETFRIYIERSPQIPYAVKTGDGPWNRYLIELVLLSPLVFLLALCGIFRGQPKGSVGRYWLLFLVTTYLIMGNVQYGMNLRYTAMWDFPLALFAVMAISSLTTRRRHPVVWAAALTGVVCLMTFRQYNVIFRENALGQNLYDPIPEYMLRAVRILK